MALVIVSFVHSVLWRGVSFRRSGFLRPPKIIPGCGFWSHPWCSPAQILSDQGQE
ncbi:Uncharacterized protein DAT39_017110 [Clarias magur]|uniref:Uncharacterized protein n=1 Tax=Clarias magur TaxID=1594786 RepID=A0A8J4UBV3_CLAMG|nr:Uncharacterized protein DAT39_017110 [Clarias magur]